MVYEEVNNMNDVDILKFWFETLSPKDWWRKNAALDKQIKNDFGAVHEEAAEGKTVAWRESDEGRLAEIIVLDQFSRNMFRGQSGSFAYDTLALDLSRAAVESGALTRLDQEKASFLLMPYMHSESLADHQEGLPLFEQYCSEATLDFERRHASIIEQFGRYPHRNAILGRESTPEELEFLKQAGSSF
jgi:uncharacterized protein (DUF924 family)